MRKQIEAFDFDKPQTITLSFGVTAFRSGDTSATLINRADEALYLAKENGRNQVRFSE